MNYCSTCKTMSGEINHNTGNLICYNRECLDFMIPKLAEKFKAENVLDKIFHDHREMTEKKKLLDRTADSIIRGMIYNAPACFGYKDLRSSDCQQHCKNFIQCSNFIDSLENIERSELMSKRRKNKGILADAPKKIELRKIRLE